MGWSGREAQQEGAICIHTADPFDCATETNTMLRSNHIPIKKIKRRILVQMKKSHIQPQAHPPVSSIRGDVLKLILCQNPGAFQVAQTVKNLLQCGRPGFDPWVRKTPWRREWQPTPVFLPAESHGQRSPVGYSLWGHKESDMTEPLTHCPCHSTSRDGCSSPTIPNLQWLLTRIMTTANHSHH